MSEHTPEVLEEVVIEQQSDPLSTVLRAAILFVIVVALTGILYLLFTNILNPPAPRTAVEAQLVAVKEAVKQNPKSGKVWGDYVRALTAARQYKPAHRELDNARRVLKGDQLLQVNIAAAELLLAEEKYKEAYELGKKNIELEKSERARVVKSMSARGVTIDPKLLGPQITTDVYLYHARSAGALKKWDEAIKSLTTALEYTPRASDLYYLRGDAYLKTGDKASAIKDFETALKFNPEFEAAAKALEKAGEK